jgi:hypothetical protein
VVVGNPCFLGVRLNVVQRLGVRFARLGVVVVERAVVSVVSEVRRGEILVFRVCFVVARREQRPPVPHCSVRPARVKRHHHLDGETRVDRRDGSCQAVRENTWTFGRTRGWGPARLGAWFGDAVSGVVLIRCMRLRVLNGIRDDAAVVARHTCLPFPFSGDAAAAAAARVSL